MAETLCNNKLEATSKQTLPVARGCYILVFAGGLIDFLLVNLKDKGTVASPFVDLNVVDELLVGGAISFIKNPEFIKCLKNYPKARAPDRSIAKIEALNDLISWNTLSTCLMRQWWQEENLGPKFVLSKCHQCKKPSSIFARFSTGLSLWHQLLDSMI
ncbi:unnamed protein product [Sphagnum balticum]